MNFEQSKLLDTLPKQFFAILVAKVNKKISELKVKGSMLLILAKEILISQHQIILLRARKNG